MVVFHAVDTLDPWHNLAVERCLFDRLVPRGDDLHRKRQPPEDFTHALMVWRNSSCVVLGRHQNPWTECNLVRMAEDRIPLVRRISGGGAVYHDPGNVNFCFMGTETHYDLDRQFGVIVTALGSLGITARRNERNDLLIGDRKISGNAFRHRRHASLHHGTLLVKTDLTLLSTYLSASDTRPEISESKGIPSVRSGVTNLTETRPDLSYTDLLDAIHRAYENEFGPAAPPTEVAAGRIAAAERELKSWEWRYGKSPTFVGTVSATIVVPDRPDAILQLSVQVRRGLVERLSVVADNTGVAGDTSVAAEVRSAEAALRGARFVRGDLEGRVADDGVQREIVAALAPLAAPGESFAAG